MAKNRNKKRQEEPEEKTSKESKFLEKFDLESLGIALFKRCVGKKAK